MDAEAQAGTGIGGIGHVGRWSGPLLVGAVAIGLAVRLIRFAGNQSLYIDEARLGLNIASRSYYELLGPLDYDQSAPPVFLLLEKLMTAAFGTSDLVLRVLPLLAGIAAVVLLYPIARRLVSERAAVLATGMLAVAPASVSFSAQVKQYTFESVVTLLLLWAVLRLEERPVSAGRQRVLLLACVVGPWVSAPSVFVIGAIFLALLCGGDTQSSTRRLIALVLVVGAGSFVGAHRVAYRFASSSGYLHDFWEAAFLTPWSPEIFKRLREATFEVPVGLVIGWPNQPRFGMEHAVSLIGIGVIVVVLWVLGIVAIVRTRGRLAGVLVGAAPLLTLGASGISSYPFSGRTMLFAAPVLVMAVASGVDALILQCGVVVRWLLIAAASAAFLATPALWTFGLLVDPHGREHLRPLVRRFAAMAGPGEPVYIVSGALPAWAFYTTDWRAPDAARLTAYAKAGSSGGTSFENAPSRLAPVDPPTGVVLHRGHPELLGVYAGMQWRVGMTSVRPRPDAGWQDVEAGRVATAANPDIWLVFSHMHPPELFLTRRLESLGATRIYRERSGGTYLFKYRFPPKGP